MADPHVKVTIDADGKAAVSGLREVEVATVAMNQAAELASKAFEFLKESFEGMSRKFAAEAKIDAVLESTKGAAGMTKQALGELATELSRTTTATGTVVREAEHMLLTFTQIGKEVFPQATETVLNMSAAFGVDAKTSAIQLGKALNDPIMGMNSLRRVGVAFTAQQREQIRLLQEQGDLQGAQKIILGELQTEFGGLAKRLAETPTGKIEEFGKAFNAAKATVMAMIIDGLMPFIDALRWAGEGINKVTDVFKEYKSVLSLIVAPIGAVIGAIAAYSVVSSLAIVRTIAFTTVENIRKVALGVMAAGQWLYNAALTAYNAVASSAILKTVVFTTIQSGVTAATTAWTAVQWLLNIALNANPIGIIITVIGALIGVTVIASGKTGGWTETLKKLWDTIKTVWEWSMRLLNPFGQIYTVSEQLYKRFPMLRAAFDAVWESIKAGYEALKKAYDAAVDFLGVGKTEAEKQKEASEEKKRLAAADFETFKSTEEGKTARLQNEIKIRADKERWTKERLDKELLLEDARHWWALKVQADKAGEDSREFEAKAREATGKMRQMDADASKKSAEEKRKRGEEARKAEIDAMEDEESRAMAQYAWDVEKNDERLRKKEIDQATHDNIVVTMERKLAEDLKKIQEQRARDDTDEAKRWRANFKVLEGEWEQYYAELDAVREAAQKRVDAADAARQIGIEILPSDRERIDAKYQYELDKLEESKNTGEMLEVEYNARRSQLDRQYADDKLALELGTAGAIFSGLEQLVSKNTAIGKSAAVAQATINTWEGATKALAQGGILGPVLAGIVIASGMASVAKILATNPEKRARGGMMYGEQMYTVSEEGDEFAVNARATARYRPMLEALNAGATPGQLAGMHGSPTLSGGRGRVVVDLTGALTARGSDLHMVIEKQVLANLASAF